MCVCVGVRRSNNYSIITKCLHRGNKNVMFVHSLVSQGERDSESRLIRMLHFFYKFLVLEEKNTSNLVCEC